MRVCEGDGKAFGGEGRSSRPPSVSHHSKSKASLDYAHEVLFHKKVPRVIHDCKLVSPISIHKKMRSLINCSLLNIQRSSRGKEEGVDQLTSEVGYLEKTAFLK